MESDTPVMEREGTSVLLVTGAPGVGKSETLTRVHDALGTEGVESAAIDTDELARSYPATERERQLAHLRALSESYRQAGLELLLVAATAESEPDLLALLEASGADQCLVIHLIASPRTLEERVQMREPAGWFGLPALIDSASQLADVRFAKTDLEISTEKHRPDEVAASVVAKVRESFGT